MVIFSQLTLIIRLFYKLMYASFTFKEFQKKSKRLYSLLLKDVLIAISFDFQGNLNDIFHFFYNEHNFGNIFAIK